MTKLSDSLRGLAERAPVGDLAVSSALAARSIRRQRAARVGANSVAGAGALAVIAFAAINPSSGVTPGSEKEQALAPALSAQEGTGAGLDAAMDSRLAWGYCGSTPLADGSLDWTLPDSLVVTSTLDDLEPGTTVEVRGTLTPASTREVESYGPQVLVLWDGWVVGIGTTETEPITTGLVEGETIDRVASLDLVNCWDGSAMPAGDYQLLVTESVYSPVALEPSVEPNPEPSTAPGGEVTETLAVEPGVAVTGDGGEGTTVNVVTVDAQTGTDGTIVSEPVAFTIAGDKVENPFANFIYVAPPTPDNAADPAILRALYAAHATLAPWNMAEGTQRVVKVSDSLVTDASGMTMTSYFQCASEGYPSVFPQESADWDLLNVTADVPSSIDVSYGWVVEDNPLISVTVSNASDLSLAGFYGEPTPSLVLVKDGQVVAEAYPTSTVRDYSVTLQASAADGWLDAGESLTGEYLWRDISGCWTESGPADVEPGTYTLLQYQYVSADNGAIYYQTYDMASSTEASAPSSLVKPAVDPAVSVAPDQNYDWLQLQVWTSLGTITVS